MGGQTGLSALVKNEAPLRWFLEHGADPNLGPPVDLRPDSAPVSNSGSAPNCAASVGTPEVFGLLLRHGAKIQSSQPLRMAAASQEN